MIDNYCADCGEEIARCPDCGSELGVNRPAAIIGLTGPARVGKDEVGRILGEERGFVQFSPADKVRDVALASDPYVRLSGVSAQTDDEADTHPIFERLSRLVEAVGWEPAKNHDDVRRFLQRLGTEGGRKHIDEDVWLDAVMSRLDPTKKYVNTSVRFANEAWAIHAAGGKVWRIEREGYGPINDHESDAALPESLVDTTIYNNWTLDDLRDATLSALAGAYPRQFTR